MIKEKYAIKNVRKNRVRKSIRKKINGTPEKPRLLIGRSNRYLYTQAVDDLNGKILVSATTLEKELGAKLKNRKDSEAAKLMGKVIAQRLKKKKISTVVFDRNIYPFVGRVKAFADSARENGLVF